MVQKKQKKKRGSQEMVQGVKRIKKVLSEKVSPPKTKIKIVGIGGGGSSIVGAIASKMKKIDFIVANTDFQSMRRFAKECKVFHFGQTVTHNLGTGMDPHLGKKAALEDKEKIEKLFRGVDLTILIASLGGGTGSGSLPIFAQAAKYTGSLVLGIFTFPFKFEGEKKALIAKESLKEVKDYLDGLILISNEKIFSLVDKKTPLQDALSYINQLLSQCLSSLIEVFSAPSFINIDFADLKTILKGKEKLAYLHTVLEEGEEKVEKILQEIFQNPLYIQKLREPKRILFNITGGKDIKVSEVEKIAKAIYEKNPQAKIIFGISHNKNYNGKIKVTLLALGNEEKEELKWKEKVSSRKEMGGEEREGGTLKKDKKTASLSKKKSKEKKLVLTQKEQKPILKRTKKKEVIKIFQTEESKKKIPLRRNALDLKKEAKRMEEEILAQESKWDTPAFLRRKKIQLL